MLAIQDGKSRLVSRSIRCSNISGEAAWGHDFSSRVPELRTLSKISWRCPA